MITISYINFWNVTNEIPDRWFTIFIKENIDKDVIEISSNNNPDILISSVCGDINNIVNIKARLKIFFCGENLNNYPQYNNIEILKSIFDLIVGFDNTDLPNKIIRFPLWLLYYPFYKMAYDNNIINYLENEHNINKNIKKDIFGTLVSRYDYNNIRKILFNELNKYGNVLCPSNFNNNCIKIGNRIEDKKKFISKSKYNICPENSKYSGYHTEKIFHALEAGTIPIYWAINNPEIEILNKNKYCFIENINDGNEVSKKIKHAIKNYKSYLNGNIFLENADKILNIYYETLKNEIIKKL